MNYNNKTLNIAGFSNEAPQITAKFMSGEFSKNNKEIYSTLDLFQLYAKMKDPAQDQIYNVDWYIYV
ncbi:MAG: hypothetical protein NZM04_02400 [Methylacidiphilales bacterium]|nr:hypothetical protein [Candidatus Methylacidiphilales bacterium]